jgi:hypothetical protein
MHRLHLDIGYQRAYIHSLVHQVAMAVINLISAQWSLQMYPVFSPSISWSGWTCLMRLLLKHFESGSTDENLDHVFLA